MNCRILPGVILSAVVIAIGAVHAGQDPTVQTPVFRTGVASVDVDVVVTDKKGNFVRDLSADDFEVFEDGVPQEISTFSFVALPTSTTSPDDADGAREGADAEGRRFIMILNGHGPRLARIAWMFVDRALSPNDQMAVYYNDPVSNAFVEGQPFTASKPQLRAVIRRIEPQFRPFQPPPFAGGGGFMSGRELAEERHRRDLDRFEMLRRAMESLAPTPGRRKAVLWFGGGFPFQWTQGRSIAQALDLAIAYRDVIRTAARHHVVIYPIDPVGLTGSIMRKAGLRALAEDTGVEGVIGTNDYEKGYARIVREMSTYYLLGYYPKVHHRDGKFHSIRIRVKRRDVTVRARKGYYADEPVRPAREAPRPPQAVETALAALRVPPELPRDASPRDAIWWRAAALPRASYERTSDSSFTRTERLRLEIPSGDTAGASAQLLDRQGNPLRVPLQVSDRADASGESRWIVVDLALAPLAIGEYVIEVTQGETSRALAFKVVP